jgi:HD superfamily phosphodiesterase
MDARKADLEQAIVSDYHRITDAVQRLESRVYQYKGYSKSADAICSAEDAIYELKRATAKLKDALEQM